jgi:hypothetical protein
MNDGSLARRKAITMLVSVYCVSLLRYHFYVAVANANRAPRPVRQTCDSTNLGGCVGRDDRI